MTQSTHARLEQAIEEITEVARGFGLDFYPMRYELCPAEVIYALGAYGMPNRFSHWSFGKKIYKMQLHYNLGLSKIYELVINADPCYAFLLNTNALAQNKMIVAHVLAHSDFFKHNARFMHTRRDMIERMGVTAERIHKYETRYGSARVEQFLDAVLAIQEHIDPRIIRNDIRAEDKNRKSSDGSLHFPARPEKDLLLFIEAYSEVLTDWQRDIVMMLHEEMLYFWPQLETKIINEGWATYWHTRMMRALDLDAGETVAFAKLNAQILSSSRQYLSPYWLGLKLFEDIERRYSAAGTGRRDQTAGRAKIFAVRALESDQSFLRNYLTEDFIRKEDLFIYEKQGDRYVITDKDWRHVRDRIVSLHTNCGFPYIVVQDGDYHHKGELLLKHRYEGMELDLHELEGVLQNLIRLWGHPVHLHTFVDGHPMLFSCNGNEVTRRRTDY